MLHNLMVMGFTTVMKHSRVYLQGARDQTFQENQSQAVWFAWEVSDCVQTNPNKRRQAIKRSRVRFDHTKQGWCEHDIGLNF